MALAVMPAGVLAQDNDADWNSLFGPETGSKEQSAGATPNSPTAESIEVEQQKVVQLPAEPLPEVQHEAPKVSPKKPGQLEEIVVTARKRTESLQEVPLSVTPFNADALEQRGMAGLDDIAAATPGFTFEAFQSGGAHGNAVIRGLAQQFTTSRIQNVSFFIDGVYLQRQSMLDLGMVDMQRIEVVKGPQNALFGRNAFAGAVNYITKRPTLEPEGYLMAATGDHSREQYRFSVSGPIGESGKLLGKFSAGVSRYDGHTKNNHPLADANPPGENLRGYLGGHNDQTFSMGLAYEPFEGLRTQTSFYRSELIHETGAGYGISGVNVARFGMRLESQNDLNCNTATVKDIGVPSPTHDRTGYTLWCGELPDYASDAAPRTVDGIVVDPRAIGFIGNTSVVTFGADYDLTPNITMYYLFGQAVHDSYTDGGTSDEDPLVGRGLLTDALVYSADPNDLASYTFANTASGRPNSELESFSHEVRFDWTPQGNLRTSAGLYYSVVEDQEWSTIYVSDLCNADSAQNIANCNLRLSHPNTLAQQTVMTVAPSYDMYYRQHGGDVRSEWTAYKDAISAVFGSVSYNFSDNIEATIEGRFSQEKKVVRRFTDSFSLRYQEEVAYDYPEHPVMPGLGNPLKSGLLVPYDEQTFNYFTPRGIVNWQFSDTSMLYASIAKGVKSGGFNNAENEEDLTYEEAENWTYEIGSKNSFFGRMITLNGAIYMVDWSGLQGGIPPQTTSASSSDIITNLGDAKSLGIEFESNILLPFGFSVDLGGTFNDAKYGNGVIYSAGRSDRNFHCDGTVCPTTGDVGGNQLARTSKVQGSLGLNYNTDVFAGWNLNMRIDTNYQSKQYLTPLNVGWVPDRLLTNASYNFSSPSGQWEVMGWVKNLTDEDYPANAFVLGVFNQYLVGKGARRTWGTTLKYNF